MVHKIRMKYYPIRIEYSKDFVPKKLKKLKPVAFEITQEELRYGWTPEQQLHQNPKLKKVARRIGVETES